MYEIILLSLVTAFCWGVTPVIYKHLLGNIAQSTLIVASALVYCLLALGYFLIYKKRVLTDIANQNSKVLLWVIVANVFVFVGQLIYVHCLHREKSYIVSAITYTSPLFTLLISYYVLKEAVSITAGLGIIFIVAGVILLAR
jgi:drug/metabolite transporter (DMT)-like permease